MPAKILVPRMARLLAVIALATLAGTCSPEPTPPPAELLGRWVADDARFQGRAMEFGPTELVLETGIEPATRHPILGVEQGEDGGAMTVLYSGEGDNPYRLSLRLDSQTGTLSLVNRPGVVWRRVGSS